MGIKNLHKVLRKYAEEAYKEQNLNVYAFKKVAIDASLYLYKYKAAAGKRWLSALLNLIMCLRRNDVHCFFVFDGKPPDEKLAEKERRAEAKDKLREKVASVEHAIRKYKKNGEIEQVLTDTLKKRRNSPSKIKRLLRNTDRIDIVYLEKYLERLRNQIISLTVEDIVKSQELLTLLGVPFCTSDTEAETLCSFMALNGLVDAVMSEDTDVLAYGTPNLLHKINTARGTCVSLRIEDALSCISMTMESFRDMCIMCGTDYNSNIPKIGSITSYNLISQHGSIDNLPEQYDKSCLNHERVRELFTVFNYELPEAAFCGTPDWVNLGTFLSKYQCQHSMDRIRRDLGPREIKFG
jgi:5'-3' exonuclease